MIRILSTKKLRVNQKQFLLNAGFSVIDADFIRTTFLPFAISNVNDNLIITSQNAVKALAAHPDVQEIRRNPVFCVGEKTADLLDEVGFTVVEIAENSSDLGRVISTDYASEKFTFFSGNIRRNELPEMLQNADVELNEIEVYETEFSPVKIASEIHGILFFSPSGVMSFLRENAIGKSVCFCIGNTTKSEVEKHGISSEKIVVANQQNVESTIAKCVNWFNKPGTNLQGFQNLAGF